MLDSASLKRVFPSCKSPDAWANSLNTALPRFGINTADRIASFLAQTGYESGQFNNLDENLNYSLAALMHAWPKRSPNEAAASPYINNPKKFADFGFDADEPGTPATVLEGSECAPYS